MVGSGADLLSALYTLGALYTVVQLCRHWKQLFDDQFTLADYQLATMAGFFLLTPIGVLVHELAHYVVAAAFGAQRLLLNFRMYWGFVSYRGNFDPDVTFLIAVAGPAASLALGLAALIVSLKLRAAWSAALESFAVATLFLVLIYYPASSFISSFGDFLAIYSLETPSLSIVAGIVHAVSLVATVVLLRKAQQRRIGALR